MGFFIVRNMKCITGYFYLYIFRAFEICYENKIFSKIIDENARFVRK